MPEDPTDPLPLPPPATLVEGMVTPQGVVQAGMPDYLRRFRLASDNLGLGQWGLAAIIGGGLLLVVALARR